MNLPNDGTLYYWQKSAVPEEQDLMSFRKGEDKYKVPTNFSLDNEAGGIEIQKSAEDGVLTGLEFGLFVSGRTEPVLTGKTNEEGTISFANVPAGMYEIRELNTPECYVIPDPISANVINDSVETVSVENNLKA